MSVRLAALDALMERICLVASNTNKLVGSIPKDLHELVYQNQAVAMRFIIAEVDRLNAEHPPAWSKELFHARAAEIRQAHEANGRSGRVPHSESVVYAMEPGQIPPGFILIDENQLRAELLGPSPAVTEHVRDVIAERISIMFKKVG